jgi:CDP-diacylglycerol---glycerol-3-phosphate 3-phosphatidyltransferase
VGLDASSLEETTVKLFNIPNLLSLSRIVTVPIFIVLLMTPSPKRVFVAGIVFAIACATDWLDGYLARRLGQITKIGKLLDPVADKILIMSALVILVNLRQDFVPAWIAIVIIGREFIITGLRSIAVSEGIIIPADTIGKYKVGAQITAVLALLFDYYYVTGWMTTLGVVALWISMVLAIYSAALYFKSYRDTLKNQSPR